MLFPVKTQFDNIEDVVKRKVKSTIQSTLNITHKSISKFKKAVKGTVNSFKREDKFY